MGSRKPFSALLTDKISDLQLVENAQCFPLYWYEEDKGEGEIDMFAEKKDDGPRYVRKDGITDYIWNLAKEQYHTSAISKEDLFYYVYGLLHSEDYRKEFAADLKKMLPRIPLVEKESDFKAFMKAGRVLADLHLHYEDEEPPEGVIVEKEADDYHVTKMRFGGKKDKSVILYNDAITIRNIPLTAYDYIVNGRSAIEWVMESYRVKADKASGIVNDPNDWAKEHDDPAYILRLLLSPSQALFRASISRRKNKGNAAPSGYGVFFMASTERMQSREKRISTNASANPASLRSAAPSRGRG